MTMITSKQGNSAKPAALKVDLQKAICCCVSGAAVTF